MPENRSWKRRVDVKAEPAAWQRLGRLLAVRRRTLGHTYRSTFQSDRLVNARLAADIEKAAKERIDTFTNESLGLIAQGYAVSYESMLAVLRGEADELVPVPVAPVDPYLILPPGEPPWKPPASAAREDEVRPWFDPVNERRVALAAAGIIDPSGAQMFPDSPDDAQAWDGIGARLEVRDRVWFIAELRRNHDGRCGPAGATGS